MIEIIPSILVNSKGDFEKKLRLVEHHAGTVHVDILDGTLFPNTTWHDARSVGAMKTDVNYELHLMVQNPLPEIEAWKKHVSTVTRAIIHAEINRPVGSVVDTIHHIHKLEAGIALNPETPLSQLNSSVHNADMLLIMGIHPGFSGQEFLGLQILKKIRKARERWPDLLIEADGGVREDNISLMKAAGCNRVCAASLIYNSDNPKEMLKKLIEEHST